MTLGGRHVSGVLVTLPGDPDLPSADPVQAENAAGPTLGATLGASTLVSDLDGQRPLRLAQPLHRTAVVSSPPLPLGPSDSPRPRAPLFLQFPRPSDKLRSGSEPLRHDLHQGQLYFCLA